MTRDTVLNWLRRHDSTTLQFSDVSRALITNSKTHRARSLEARSELRAVLLELEREGVVRLVPTTNGCGARGVQIEVVTPTHEKRNL